jgi:sugar phosphate isomerase/epimerase
VQLSVQLYSLRAIGDFDAQLALCRKVGFSHVESVATHGLAPADFAARLAAHGLALSSMHAAIALLEDTTERNKAIEACRATGCPLIVMPWLPMGERAATGAGWQAMGARLARLGEIINAAGLRLAYHNHEWEFLSYDGQTALEWIFGAAAAELLGWEADLGWVRRAGQPPLQWIERFADRLESVHAKDIATPGQGRDEDGWAALGEGIVGWPVLLPALRARCNLFVLEHDLPKDHEAMLRTSLACMRRHLT